MINKKILEKIVKTSQDFSDIQNGRCKHFSFLVSKNTIVSFGWNDYNKTHTIAKKFGHYEGRIHSELACIVSCQRKLSSNMIIVNTRIGTNNTLMMSKPCDCCQRMLLWYNIQNVVYSTSEGFKCLNLINPTKSHQI